MDPARSALMARVRQKHSGPELIVRAMLRELDVKYRLHPKRLPGRPDISIASQNRVLFVHGCFWHRHPSCPRATTPKVRREFWLNKFEANVARDARNIDDLRKLGWKVTVVWECQCSNAPVLRRQLRRLFPPEHT